METFDDVYRRHMSVVLRTAARVVGRRDVAEEITADAFLELYRQFGRIDVDRLPGWLLTVVRNRGIDYWRRQQNERLLARDASAAPATSEPAPRHDNLFAHPALKPMHRVCLVLRYEHGLSREEIGRRLGLTDTQVRGHLQYALALLRKNLVAQTG
jgi:RNA polymerase sigma-70 factor, ECF subfamily